MSQLTSHLASTTLPSLPVEAIPALRTRRISTRSQRRLFVAALVVADILMLSLAFTLAYWTRFQLSLPVFELYVQPSVTFYRMLAAWLVALWLVMLVLFQAYDWTYLLGGTQEYSKIASASTMATVLVIAVGFINPTFIVARGWLLSAWVLTFICTAAARFALRRGAYALRRHGYFITPALIVGTNDEALALAYQLSGWQSSGLNVLGLVADGEPVDELAIGSWPVLGHVCDLPGLIADLGVEEIIVTRSALPQAEVLEILRYYSVDSDISVHLSSGLFDVLATGLNVHSLGYVPLIGINKVRLSRIEGFMKSTFDHICALCGLVSLAPLLLAIAVWIKLDSPGPVIHRRRVLGRGGRVFDAYKFRTMHVNSDGLLTPEQQSELVLNQKLKKDPRVTTAGAWLRKYSLDELPQLVNVLGNQMSLVGPRMITPAESSKYGKWATNLLTVNPGLSGLWQVSGRSDLSYEERVRLDMYYIRNYSIWLDMQIVLRTITVILGGKGAY